MGVSAVPAGRQAARSAQPERGLAADAAGDALPFDGAAVEETQRGSATYVGGGCLRVLLFVFIFLVVGVILGTRAFLRRAAAAVKINLFGRRGLLIRPRLSGVELQSLGGARAVVAVSACVCVYLFALSMYTAAQASNPEAPAVIVADGFFLGLPGAPIL